MPCGSEPQPNKRMQSDPPTRPFFDTMKQLDSHRAWEKIIQSTAGG
jgi:hypothetical protein